MYGWALNIQLRKNLSYGKKMVRALLVLWALKQDGGEKSLMFVDLNLSSGRPFGERQNLLVRTVPGAGDKSNKN